eukprot:7168506-Lingulodinium_polyedra.AAC.1
MRAATRRGAATHVRSHCLATSRGRTRAATPKRSRRACLALYARGTIRCHARGMSETRAANRCGVAKHVRPHVTSKQLSPRTANARCDAATAHGTH